MYGKRKTATSDHSDDPDKSAKTILEQDDEPAGKVVLGQLSDLVVGQEVRHNVCGFDIFQVFSTDCTPEVFSIMLEAIGGDEIGSKGVLDCRIAFVPLRNTVELSERNSYCGCIRFGNLAGPVTGR